MHCMVCRKEKTVLVKVVVEKPYGLAEEKHCYECIVLPVYKDSGEGYTDWAKRMWSQKEKEKE